MPSFLFFLLLILTQCVFTKEFAHPKVYWFGRGGHSWNTKDGGVTVNYVDTKSELWNVKVHPSQPGWLLAFRYSECCWTNPTCNDCDGEVTRNFTTFNALVCTIARLWCDMEDPG